METKYLTIPFEIKQQDEDEKYFYFEGYGSTFNNVDLIDDVIAPNAFAESLKERKPKLLWQHQMDQPLGIFTEVFEDDKGLFVKGKMPKADSFVKERVMPQMQIGSVDSMSIGFNVIESVWNKRDGKDIRTLIKLLLFEISLVTLPMNPKANITATKSIVPFQDLPLVSREIEWDPSAAAKRIKDKTGSEDAPSKSYRKAFFCFDEKNSDTFGAYKFLYADVIGGKLKAVPRAIFAVAGALQEANWGTDISEADQEKIKKNVEKYYEKMDLVAPWLEKALKIEDIKTQKDINIYLKDYGLSKHEIDGVMAKMRNIIKQGNPGSGGNPQEGDLKLLITNNIDNIKKLTESLKGDEKYGT